MTSAEQSTDNTQVQNGYVSISSDDIIIVSMVLQRTVLLDAQTNSKNVVYSSNIKQLCCIFRCSRSNVCTCRCEMCVKNFGSFMRGVSGEWRYGAATS